MYDLVNLVRVTTTTVGTGTVTLGSAVTGFLTMTQAGATDEREYSYAIEADYVTVGDDSVPTSREVGYGTWDSGAGTLTRNVINSTNSNALLNLAGDAQVIICVLAESFEGLAESNLVINSGIEVAQQTASTAGVTASGYIADMFEYISTAADTVTISQSTEAPSGFQYSALVDVTTADASIAAGDLAIIQHAIEGYRVARLGFGAAGALSISIGFWVRAFRAGTYCIAVQNASQARSYVSQYTIDASNTWEYKTVTITGDTSGTWETTTSAGIYIQWALACGSTFQTSAGAWAAGNFSGTSSQVNALQSTSDTLQITGVSLVPGDVPVSEAQSRFVMRPFDEELSRCQRYYEKSYNYATALGDTGTVGAMQTLISGLAAGTYGATGLICQFSVRKRTTPTMTAYAPGSGTINRIRDQNAAADLTVNFFAVGDSGFFISPQTVSNSWNIVGHWVADARL